MLNQPNFKNVPGSNFWFCWYFFSEERQTYIVMKANILNVMDEYWLSNPLFCRGVGVKMAIFTWDSKPNYKGKKGKNDFRKIDHNIIFTPRLVGLLVKSIHFSNLCCIMCQWWPFRNGETALFKFFLQSLQACNSRSIKDIPFRYWVLTNFPFGIFTFKALYGSVPEILEF